MSLKVVTYVDGEEPECLDEIIDHWKTHWDSHFSSIGSLQFATPINLKENSGYESLPEDLKKISKIRNPDIYFYCETLEKEIGGIEITVHSPDGSNVEKRYPFIWASRKYGANAFVASPYMKVRPTGAMNKLPHRHASRNLDLVTEWDLDNNNSIQQIIPTIHLQEQVSKLPKDIRDHMFTWEDYAIFLSSYLAFISDSSSRAKDQLLDLKTKMIDLATACKNNTRFTHPSTFIETNNRWIQIYNSRPDSGHWERGEGQFDSIDGRLMFTLDQIDFCASEDRPSSFEFWLPQMSKNHAWIREQMGRGYGSKRLRNIMVELNSYCTVKFMEDLSSDDISLLIDNPSLTLERLDWGNEIFKVSELLNGMQAATVARKGLKSPSAELISALTDILSNEKLYVSTHRIYFPDCVKDFETKANSLPDNSVILAPRIPGDFMSNADLNDLLHIKFGGDCSKEELLALRQLHRCKAH